MTGTYRYDSFGNVISGNPPSDAYTGKWQRETDTATGLVRMGVREYDPTLGRFVSADQLNGNPANPQQRSRYPYVGNDPLSSYDLSGLFTISLGGSLNIQLGPINIHFSSGFAIDSSGNVGAYNTAGGGFGGTGAEASGGLSLNASNANSICDLSGPFASGNVGGGLGGGAAANYFTGPSQDGWVTGGGVTLGAGLGAGGSVGGTDTYVNPLWRLW